jgi:glycine C-acetyltransferase
LEKTISRFLHTEDTILFSSSFAANVAFFQAVTNEKLGCESYKDVLYSDRLNHASIIDGQRLCKPETTDRKIYAHGNMQDLERQLDEDRSKGYRILLLLRKYLHWQKNTMRLFLLTMRTVSASAEKPAEERRKSSD